ncbi:MAG: 2-C-methyl-D-erythritol 4-phosphate cytidylyltransferase, partial [Calditrichaeota bacterium]|nr:2-C-methyl-D-erythritol 4-phosphate cytidylyltransferase [Calditrichota bacterium]
MKEAGLGRVAAIIAAGGKGVRAGTPINKQFVEIAGKPILAHTLDVFQTCEVVDEVLVVAPADWLFFVAEQIVDRFGFSKVRRVVEGGAERQDSVYEGLSRLDEDVDVVLIHDAARPFVTEQEIRRVTEAAQRVGAAICAVRPRDTVKRGPADEVETTLPRNELWLVQTPQGFQRQLI